MILTTAATLERSASPYVLPVDLRLHANAPVFTDVIIGFCLMGSLHAYRVAQNLALFAKTHFSTSLYFTAWQQARGS